MKGFKKKHTSVGPIRDKNGDLQTEDKQTANTFNKNLVDQLLPGQKPNIDWTTIHPQWNKIRPDQNLEPFHPTFFDPGNTHIPESEETLAGIYITPIEVAEKIKSANKNVAASPDELPMKFYVETHIECPTSFLYNFITQTGRVTKVKMLYKKKDKDDPQNYRPLSMSNHLGKIWERIMNSHLKTHLEKHGLLSARQHGFRDGMGTTSNLLQLNCFHKYY